MSNKGFRRKQYGPVRPVKQPKQSPVNEKPERAVLVKALSALKKSSDATRRDLLVHICHWHIKMRRWRIESMRLSGKTLATKQAKLVNDMYSQSSRVVGGDEKQLASFIALSEKIEKELGVDKVPPLAPALKLAMASAKKIAAASAKIEEKNDPFFKMWGAAFGGRVSFRVEPVVKDAASGASIEWKKSWDGKTITYSRAYVKELKTLTRKKGLLPVFCREAARRAGSVSEDALIAFCKFAAAHPLAPNRLVVRTAQKPEKPKKLSLMDKKRERDSHGQSEVTKQLSDAIGNLAALKRGDITQEEFDRRNAEDQSLPWDLPTRYEGDEPTENL